MNELIAPYCRRIESLEKERDELRLEVEQLTIRWQTDVVDLSYKLKDETEKMFKQHGHLPDKADFLEWILVYARPLSKTEE